MTPEHAATMRDFIKKIVHHKSEWVPLLCIPSCGASKKISKKSRNFWEFLHNVQEEDWCGVYQVSVTCPDEIVHKDIGYVGTSEYFPYRLYNLKSSTTSAKNTHHKCGRFLYYSPIEPSQVFVRMLYTSASDAAWLEDLIQQQMRSQFKYAQGFQWEQASGGPAGSLMTAFDGIARLSTISEIEQVEAFLAKQKATLTTKLHV